MRLRVGSGSLGSVIFAALEFSGSGGARRYRDLIKSTESQSEITEEQRLSVRPRYLSRKEEKKTRVH